MFESKPNMICVELLILHQIFWEGFLNEVLGIKPLYFMKDYTLIASHVEWYQTISCHSRSLRVYIIVHY